MNELEREYQTLLLLIKSNEKLILRCTKSGLEFRPKTDQGCFDCWQELDPELSIQFEHRGQCIAKHCIIREEKICK